MVKLERALINQIDSPQAIATARKGMGITVLGRVDDNLISKLHFHSLYRGADRQPMKLIKARAVPLLSSEITSQWRNPPTIKQMIAATLKIKNHSVLATSLCISCKSAISRPTISQVMSTGGTIYKGELG